MPKRNDPANDTSGRELVITRVFDASPALVFEAWTDPKHLINWWGPTGFTNTFLEIDIKPGGVWRFIMHGPDGTNYDNRIVYMEVEKPTRLVYLHSSDREDDPRRFQVTVSFEKEGAGKTRLVMKMLFLTAEELDKVVKQYGAVEGANQTLDRLEAELVKMQ